MQQNSYQTIFYGNLIYEKYLLKENKSMLWDQMSMACELNNGTYNCDQMYQMYFIL